MKPYAESCEQNKEPIYQIVKAFYSDVETVLEIGSGSGQHAVYFAEQFPHLTWLASDQAQYHAGINMWLQETKLSNIQGPFLLDVDQADWPVKETDAIFSANTVHIMGWTSVEKMFTGIGRVLKPNGVFCLYGPFNYNGQFSSQSNAQFDVWLKQRDPLSGVRDFEALDKLARAEGMQLQDDVEMPANNRILVWRKQ